MTQSKESRHCINRYVNKQRISERNEVCKVATVSTYFPASLRLVSCISLLSSRYLSLLPRFSRFISSPLSQNSPSAVPSLVSCHLLIYQTVISSPSRPLVFSSPFITFLLAVLGAPSSSSSFSLSLSLCLPIHHLGSHVILFSSSSVPHFSFSHFILLPPSRSWPPPWLSSLSFSLIFNLFNAHGPYHPPSYFPIYPITSLSPITLPIVILAALSIFVLASSFSHLPHPPSSLHLSTASLSQHSLILVHPLPPSLLVAPPPVTPPPLLSAHIPRATFGQSLSRPVSISGLLMSLW